MIGFIIMQIGDPELDQVCETALVPAIEACGLSARRVDKHNEGGLLKSEIIRFIQEAQIIVADLTNERPNVYLEIGYAMGIDKFSNLILTVRADHFPDHRDRKPGGPKVHFDLAGYDVLQWEPGDLSSLRLGLEKRIRQRLALIRPTQTPAVEAWDEEWIGAQRKAAQEGLDQLRHNGRMEIRASLYPPKISKSLRELQDAARQAPIRTFDWPIGLVVENDDDARPKPRTDGIAASVIGFADVYDYWAIRRNGDFFCVKSIFEDTRSSSVIFFDTRIVRVTEALLYLLRLYDNLGVDRSSFARIAIRHSGLTVWSYLTFIRLMTPSMRG